MINTFVYLIKLRKLNLSAQQLTYILLAAQLQPSWKFCRSCQSSKLSFWCHYSRKLTDLKNGKLNHYVLETKRFRCGSCGSTHAFLVPLVVPYAHHSILFILSVLFDYYNKRGTVKQICKRYEISIQTLYNWKKLFLKHQEEWFGYVRDANETAITFLKQLLDDEDYADFSRQFMQGRPDRRAFMQSHKNANNHRFV